MRSVRTMRPFGNMVRRRLRSLIIFSHSIRLLAGRTQARGRRRKQQRRFEPVQRTKVSGLDGEIRAVVKRGVSLDDWRTVRAASYAKMHYAGPSNGRKINPF